MPTIYQPKSSLYFFRKKTMPRTYHAFQPAVQYILLLQRHATLYFHPAPRYEIISEGYWSCLYLGYRTDSDCQYSRRVRNEAAYIMWMLVRQLYPFPRRFLCLSYIFIGPKYLQTHIKICFQ
jgi:hypothetical protein